MYICNPSPCNRLLHTLCHVMSRMCRHTLYIYICYVMSRMWRSLLVSRHVNEDRVPMRIYITHMNASCHTYEWGMSRRRMSRVKYKNESRHTTHSYIWHVTSSQYEWDTSLIPHNMNGTRHVTSRPHNMNENMNEARHSFVYMTRHILTIWMRHVTSRHVLTIWMRHVTSRHVLTIWMRHDFVPIWI